MIFAENRENILCFLFPNYDFFANLLFIFSSEGNCLAKSVGYCDNKDKMGG